MAEPKKINLALQGGGAHGAFTWGVLDWFLQDSRLSIDAITGTSAGAMNAVVLASGMEAGGEEGARASLEKKKKRRKAEKVRRKRKIKKKKSKRK